MRSYQPQSRITYSPERTPIDHAYSFGEDSRGAGLRRRPSQAPVQRRHSQGEYDQPRPSFSDQGSRRPLRSKDDSYYRDEDRTFSRRDDFAPHPDAYERSRPPRSYHNVGYDKRPSSASKPYFDETRGDRDLERGDWNSERKRVSDEESVDGYNYDQHNNARATIDFKNLTKEERAEVMRLPWTQWMNSGVKNRTQTSFPHHLTN